jgi:hypothetical protein
MVVCCQDASATGSGSSCLVARPAIAARTELESFTEVFAEGDRAEDGRSWGHR